MSNAFPIFPHATNVDPVQPLGSTTYHDSGRVATAADRDRVGSGTGGAAVVKRAMDIAGASCALAMLFIPIMIIALLVRLDSPGPSLFRQRRLGRGGRTFWCLKFRTMTVDAEQRLGALESLNESAGGVLFKIRQDPRVTRIGKFLRKTSLDELPQFFNVLKGEMSLVGPRPLQLRDCELLEAMDPEGFRQRLSVPQGITGAWQVGGRSNLDSEGMLKLDLDYAKDWSIGLDLRILFRTVYVVLAGRGAC